MFGFPCTVSRDRARSSVGQSSELIIRWSLVRVQAGPLERPVNDAGGSSKREPNRHRTPLLLHLNVANAKP